MRPRSKKLLIGITLLVLCLACAGWLFITGAHQIRHEKIKVASRGAELAATISLPRWGSGPFPAIVCVHGSGPRTAQDLRIVWRHLVPEGLVVLTYDKPGVGESTGEFVEVDTRTSEQQLRGIADNILACREALKKNPLVDPKRIGLFGGSQAGWIIPLACDTAKDVPFSVVLAGPATSYGMEMYFSTFTGDGIRPGSNLTLDQIEERLDTYSGIIGFEPLPILSRSNTPTLWLFGERDLSIPAVRSAKILNRLKDQGRDFTIINYPDGDHNLQHHATGAHLPYWQDILAWLHQQKMLN